MIASVLHLFDNDRLVGCSMAEDADGVGWGWCEHFGERVNVPMPPIMGGGRGYRLVADFGVLTA